MHAVVEAEQLWLIELQPQAETPFGASERKALTDEVRQSLKRRSNIRTHVAKRRSTRQSTKYNRTSCKESRREWQIFSR